MQAFALVRIVSKIKGDELLSAEKFEPVVMVARAAIYHAAVAQSLVEEETRLAFARDFKARMKTDPTLRQRIGGIRWQVDLIRCSYRDAI